MTGPIIVQVAPDEVTIVNTGTGVRGPIGPPNALSIHSVTTGAPGTSAAVTISGTPPSQQLDITIPRGDPGPPNTLSIGSVTTGAPGSQAAVTISGASPTQSLSLTVPRGDTGAQGYAVRNGTGVPANLLGVDGDFYIQTDITPRRMQGPKSAGVWPNNWWDVQFSDLATALSARDAAVAAQTAAQQAATQASQSAAGVVGAVRKIYYVDSSAVDTNSGLSSSTPKKTIAAVAALVQNGDIVLFRRGGRWFESLTGLQPYVIVGAYGYGAKPIFDGSRPLPQTGWTQDTTNPLNWYLDVTHTVATSPGGIAANSFHAMVWDERAAGRDAPLTPYWAGADITANRAYVGANPGTFTCYKVGSTVKDPRTDTSGTQYRYYVHLSDGSSPNSASIQLYYAEQVQVMSLNFGNIVSDIVVQRTATKDMAGHNQNDSAILENVEFYDAPVHAWVGGAIHLRNCRAVTRLVSADSTSLTTSQYFAGAAFHGFRATATNGESRGFVVEGCYAEGYGVAVYSHGTGGTANEHPQVVVRRVESRSCSTVLSMGTTDHGWTAEDIVAYDYAAFANVSLNARLIRCKGTTNQTNATALELYGDKIYAEDCSFAFGAGGYLYRNEVALTQNDGTTYTVTLNRISKVGGYLSDSNARRRQVNLVATDCVLDDVDASGSGYPWSTITAKNTQFRVRTMTLSEIQAANPGVGSDCLVPWVDQTYNRTVVSGDVSYLNSSRVVSGSSGGVTLTYNFRDNDLVVGQAIRILNIDGAGTNFTTTVASLGATGSSGTITVTDPFPNAFSSKTPARGYYNHQLWPQSAGTGVLSDDGTQLYVASDEPYAVGQTIYLGTISGRRGDPFGPRKITAKSAGTLTLDKPALWRNLSTTITYAPFGTTTGVPRPTVSVGFGFTLRSASGATGQGPSVTLTKVVGSNITGAEPNSSTAMLSGHQALRASDGAVLSYGEIQHELGYVDCGFAVAAGDVVTASAAARVEDYLPVWVGTPTLTGQAVLRAGSILAGRNMGARWQQHV